MKRTGTGNAAGGTDRFREAISCLHMTLERQIRDELAKMDENEEIEMANEPKVTEPVEREQPKLLITSVSDPKLIETVPEKEDVAFDLDLSQATQTESGYSERQFKDAIERLMTRKRRPPDEMVSPLKAYIKKSLANAIIDQDYDSAEYLKEAEDRLNAQKVEDVNFKAEKSKRIKTVDDRISGMKERIEEIKAKWAEKIANFDREKKEKLDEIKAKHEAELDRFEEHWNESTTMMAFSKPSPQLLQIRKLQRTSALANDFQRARELKRKGDDLEKLETQQATQKATLAMQVAYKNLKEKQSKELEFTTMNWRRQLIMMQGERDSELKQANLCLKQLQLKKDECKASKVRPLSCITPKRREPKALATPTTPRTRRQLADYRFISTQEKLTLMGFDVKDVVRGRRPATAKRRANSVARRPDLQI